MTTPSDHPPATICVYVGLDLIGDGLMKLPFLRALRAAYPAAKITWLAGKGPTVFARDLAGLATGLIDEVIENAGIGSGVGELFGARPLSGRRFDLVIDTQRRVLTTLILRRIAHDLFVSGAAGYWLSDRRPATAEKPKAMIRQMLALVELAAGRPADIAAAPLSIAPEVLAHAHRLLPDGPRYVALAPGAGGRHKCWPLDRYIALAERLKARGAVPVFILGPGEAEWVERCRQVAGAILPLQDVGGPASAELTIALARRCAAAVANDSGAGHLIAAADIPLVSLFGPTAPDKFAPMTRTLTILRAQDFGGEAMDAIPVEAVEQALG
ncbi:MAG: glycosyltransferase family 9 protein [Rhodospirillales bacterium]|nr:glycosyltransferase family 9 protein [Rhodospirillales bacterium]